MLGIGTYFCMMVQLPAKAYGGTQFFPRTALGRAQLLHFPASFSNGFNLPLIMFNKHVLFACLIKLN